MGARRTWTKWLFSPFIRQINAVWTIASDEAEAERWGSDLQRTISSSKAIQALLDKMQTDGHITRTLIVEENQRVPVDRVLKKTLKVAGGENPPGLLVFTGEPVYIDPDEDNPEDGNPNRTCIVTGKIPAATSTLTLRRVWGPP